MEIIAEDAEKYRRLQIDNIDEIIKSFWEDRSCWKFNSVDELIRKCSCNFDAFFKNGVSSDELLFRGQQNSEYGFNSSLYRTILSHKEKYEKVEESDLKSAEKELLDEMIENQGLGRNMTKGQLLMVLQHYGTPTRLIDVSTTALEALYFAVEGQDSKDGVFFVINPDESENMKLHDTSSDRSDRITFNKDADDELVLPWWKYKVTRHTSDSEWTNTVKVIKHLSLDPRMHAQNGVFLVGGLNKRYTSTFYPENSGCIDYAIEKPTIYAGPHTTLSSLTINWKKKRNDTRMRKGMSTFGWVILIPKEHKPEIRRKLNDLGINSNTIYPPFLEVQRLSQYMIKKAV